MQLKNKINSTPQNQSITQKKDIVLVWPYKNAILTGNQSKKEKKQNELFYHKELHINEINQLLEEKVFTLWTRFTEKGKIPVQNLMPNDNLIIRGNNLMVLHSLRKRFQEKIKLIYIDPPYNTGSSSFLYNDRFTHSTWLTFMKNRLEIAYKLLHSEGAFFIHVDDSEFAYLKVLCDELFGRENHKETIVLKSSTESGVNAINVKRGQKLFKVKEYVLFYAKSKNFRFNPFYTKAAYNFNYKYELSPNGKLINLKKKFTQEYASLDLSREEKNILINARLEKYALSHTENIYSLEKNIKKAGKKFKEFAQANISKNKVELFKTIDGRSKKVYKGGELVALKERIVQENGKNYFGILASDLWIDIATSTASEGGVKFTNGKKPEKLLKRIIEMTTQKGDIILDYHLGSGTTAAVAHKLGRQYIGIEQLDYGENDSTKRLQNVIGDTNTYDNSGISKETNWKGGGNFVYTELMKFNHAFIQQILNSKTNNALWNIYLTIKQKGLIKHKMTDENLEQSKKDFWTLSTQKQQAFLIEILNKNQLYIPYSSINDNDLAISETDKRLTKQFYNE